MKTRSSEVTSAQPESQPVSDESLATELYVELARLRLSRVELSSPAKCTEEDTETLNQVNQKISIIEDTIGRILSLKIKPSSEVQSFIPSNLPKFNNPVGTTPFDITDFVESFEALLHGSGVPMKKWCQALFSTLRPEDSSSLLWMNSNIPGKEWKEVKKLLLKQFHSFSLFRFYEKQYTSISCHLEENIMQFSSRFSRLVIKLGKDINSLAVLDKFVLGLSPCLQNAALPLLTSIETFDSLVHAISRMEAVVNVHRENPCFPDKTSANIQHSSSSVIPSNSKTMTTEPTEKFTRQSLSSTSKQSVIKDFGSSSTSGRLASQPAEVPKNFNQQSYSCSYSSSNFDNRLFIYLSLNNTRVKALVDTGSQISIVSESLIKSMPSVQIETTSTMLLGFSSHSSVSPIGVTQSLLLEYASKSFQCSLYVVAIPSVCDVILGMDALSALGITIGNLSSPFEGNNSDDVKYQPLEPVDEIEEPLPKSKQNYILNFISNSLTSNKLTEHRLCSHPLAVVSLPTGNNKPSFVRQYRIPKALHKSVEDAVKLWQQMEL